MHDKYLMKIRDIINELTFYGSQCTKDCSGHKAGWEWERRHKTGHRAGSHSNSFNNGTEIATRQAQQGKNPIGPQIRGQGGRFQKFQKVKESIDNLDMDQAYELFKATYEKETGASWSKDKFMQRASNWDFYGDPTGFIAVRPQRSGLVKLTGAAGSPRGILKGIKELQSENKPIWGMASKPLAAQLSKLGLIQPPGLLLKAISTMIPKSVFGDVPFTVNMDGGVTFQYSDVGPATKYFVASPEYFKQILTQIPNAAIPDTVKAALTKGINSLGIN